jgi:hypothetical protein
MLAWHQTEPGRKVAAILKLCTFTNRGNDRGSCLGAHALDARQALAGLISFKYGFDLLVKN